jgi:hypothetical protein
MAFWAKIIGPAVVGAALGWLTGRRGLRSCGREGCKTTLPVPAAILAGAAAGAAIGFAWASQ